MPAGQASPLPTIAISAGDPCGVGPEVILKTLSHRSAFASFRSARLVILGDHEVFERAARRMGRRLPAWRVLELGRVTSALRDPLTFIDHAHHGVFTPGRSTARAGAASIAYLNEAVRLAVVGAAQALVTAPVTKWAIERSVPRFSGQTEHLAHAFKTRDAAMLFVSESLRVVLLTRHVPLAEVGRLVDRRLMRTTVAVSVKALKDWFGVARPRVAFCGLNPHAGEGGLFGREESAVLLPVMRLLGRQGVRCEGPFAADGLFARLLGGVGRNPYDLIVSWYHDQGLIPFKMAARDAGCQLTAGLPVIRTSPDHGSALDIAGRGLADPGSMRYALRLAMALTLRRARLRVPPRVLCPWGSTSARRPAVLRTPPRVWLHEAAPSGALLRISPHGFYPRGSTC